MWDFQIFIHPFFLKIVSEKCKLMNNGFNNIQNEWFNSYANVKIQKMWKNSLTHSSINVKH
jgi:hypothetical protein